jgi:hypothetical protein
VSPVSKITVSGIALTCLAVLLGIAIHTHAALGSRALGGSKPAPIVRATTVKPDPPSPSPVPTKQVAPVPTPTFVHHLKPGWRHSYQHRGHTRTGSHGHQTGAPRNHHRKRTTTPTSSRTPTPTPTVTSTPLPVHTVVFRHDHGNTGDLFGLGTYIAQRYPGLVGPALRRAQKTGSDWVREEFTANKLHHATNAAYWWKPFDRVVARERKLGFHILGLLDYNNTWNGQPHSDMPHRKMAILITDYVKYVTAIVKHYRGQINYWQVWNEPDLHHFWGPHANARDYARLLTASYHAIKSANPHAEVVLGGPSDSAPHPLAFINHVVRAGGKFDIVSIQPYMATPGQTLLRQIAKLKRYRKPVWFTEIGWAGEDWCAEICGEEAPQAGRLARLYFAAAFTGVERVFWYDFRDDGTGSDFEDHFGLLQHNFGWKPAYSAYSLSSFFLNRATVLGRAVVTGDVYGLQVKTHHRKALAFWNNSTSSVALRVTWGKGGSLITSSGLVTTIPTSHKKATITLPPTSVYYVAPKGLSLVVMRPHRLARWELRQCAGTNPANPRCPAYHRRSASF